MSYYKKWLSGGSLGSQMIIETDIDGNPIVNNSTGASSGPIEFLMGMQSNPSGTTINGAFLKWLFGSMEINATLIKLYGSIDVSTNYVDIGEIGVPSDPSANIRRLFVDDGSGELSVRTAGGATVSLESAGGIVDHDNTYHTPDYLSALPVHNNTYHNPDYHTETDGTGAVTIHSGVTDAGSGIIISNDERTALHAIYTLQQHNNSFHSTNYEVANANIQSHVASPVTDAHHAKYTNAEVQALIDATVGIGSGNTFEIHLTPYGAVNTASTMYATWGTQVQMSNLGSQDFWSAWTFGIPMTLANGKTLRCTGIKIYIRDADTGDYINRCMIRTVDNAGGLNTIKDLNPPSPAWRDPAGLKTQTWSAIDFGANNGKRPLIQIQCVSTTANEFDMDVFYLTGCYYA